MKKQKKIGQADKLRFFANECYGTLRAFAEKCGITEVTIQNYLVGIRKPQYDILVKFLHAGMSTDWLLDELENRVEKMFSETLKGRELKARYYNIDIDKLNSMENMSKQEIGQKLLECQEKYDYLMNGIKEINNSINEYL